MGNSTLYDEDILPWPEQQAAVIRRLGLTRHDLPNELDIENVAKEVESVGRSELVAPNPIAGLPTVPPFTLDDLLVERIDGVRLVQRLRQASTSERD
jgi:hypothetical protein